jgi:flagellar hook-associated protein 3 FlgL
MTLPLSGFPAQPRNDLMSRLIRELRGNADIARKEAVTGLLADPAGARRSQISELLGLERSLATLSQYNEIIDLSEARAGVIQRSLGSLRDLAVELHSSGLTALQDNGGTATETLSVLARQALTAAVSALNVSFGGRGLFSGDQGGLAIASAEMIFSASMAVVQAGPTGAAAYASLTVQFTLAGGFFDTGLYTGGSGDAPASEVAEDERIAFAPRADAAPVRALLRDIAALAAAFDPASTLPADERRDLAKQAVSGLLNGVDELAVLSARVGVAEERMSVLRARHGDAATALSNVFNKLAGRDQYEAAAELTQIEAQLETSYITTARLSHLSLASFLR